MFKKICFIMMVALAITSMPNFSEAAEGQFQPTNMIDQEIKQSPKNMLAINMRLIEIAEKSSSISECITLAVDDGEKRDFEIPSTLLMSELGTRGLIKENEFSETGYEITVHVEPTIKTETNSFVLKMTAQLPNGETAGFEKELKNGQEILLNCGHGQKGEVYLQISPVAYDTLRYWESLDTRN